MSKNYTWELNFKASKALHFLVIFIVVFLAYGLINFHFFSFRNDVISYYLPTRVYISDALKHHEFLLWNPFLSGSYPMHSDTQGAVWNPIVLVLAGLFNYNHT